MKLNTRILVITGSLVIALTGIVITRPTAAHSSEIESANLVRLTAQVLERSQFAHHRLDDELAGKFLDRYLDALDGSGTLFIKSEKN
jgi:hypothetical protein